MKRALLVLSLAAGITGAISVASADDFVEEVNECMTRRNDMTLCLSLAKVTVLDQKVYDLERRAANIAPDRQQEFECLQKSESWAEYRSCRLGPWLPASEPKP